MRLAIQETSSRDAEEDANVERATREHVSQLQRQRQDVDHQADQENLRQATAASEAEAHRHASELEALEYDPSCDPGYLAGTTQSEFEAQ